MKLTHTYSGHDIMNNEKTPVSCFTSGKRLSCLFAFLFFFGFTAVAQVKNINKTTGTVPVPFHEIDSVWFDAAGGQMKVVKQNGTVQGHAFSEINNITFSANNYPASAVHCTLPTVLSEVTNPLTGRTWMDRNLGASRVALSPNDSLAFGDLYQWGRRTDGHQCRNSPTTAVQSNSPQTSNNNFVLTNYPTTDWLSTPDNSLWQGYPGANNPCPSGFRLPTVSEMQQEQSSWTSNNMAGAFAGPLKWTMPGYRDFDGTFFDVNNGAYYWCSNTDSLDARYLFITPNTSTVLSSIRSLGYSVRCIKELPQAPASCGASDVHNPNLSYGSMYDQDGNVYKTIVIGTQEWMAENLKASHYRNGDLIPVLSNGSSWQSASGGASCFYNNDSAANNCPYGKLYDWYAVSDARQLCPNGWHVPTDAEWTTLGSFLGGDFIAGGKMKSTGTQYWLSPNTAADNSSGFSGLPGGHRSELGDYFNLGSIGCWWSSSQANTTDAWTRTLDYSNTSGVLSSYVYNLRRGYSVRCIRDEVITGSLVHSCGADSVHNPNLSYGSMYDQDGNAYKTIVIGTQEWMAENLKASHYRNGDLIPVITDSAAWINTTGGATSFYNNDSATYNCPFGKLYNWYAASDARNLCPNGWHVPTDAEWNKLVKQLDAGADTSCLNCTQSTTAGGKIKSTGTQYWQSPNAAADNSSGFSGLPTGNRDWLGPFSSNGSYAYWWTSNQVNTSAAQCRYLGYPDGSFIKYEAAVGIGFSVRCLRD